MENIHKWSVDTRVRVGEKPENFHYYLELEKNTDEDILKKWWGSLAVIPDFVVAPDLGESHGNTIAANNVRRILSSQSDPFIGPSIAVMIQGATRGERIAMAEWLVENDYLPMLGVRGRYPALLEQQHVIRAHLDSIWVLHEWHEYERPARAFVEDSTQNSWELLNE